MDNITSEYNTQDNHSDSLNEGNNIDKQEIYDIKKDEYVHILKNIKSSHNKFRFLRILWSCFSFLLDVSLIVLGMLLGLTFLQDKYGTNDFQTLADGHKIYLSLMGIFVALFVNQVLLFSINNRVKTYFHRIMKNNLDMFSEINNIAKYLSENFSVFNEIILDGFYPSLDSRFNPIVFAKVRGGKISSNDWAYGFFEINEKTGDIRFIQCKNKINKEIMDNSEDKDLPLAIASYYEGGRIIKAKE